jgi:hypothetical protein
VGSHFDVILLEKQMLKVGIAYTNSNLCTHPRIFLIGILDTGSRDDLCAQMASEEEAG